MGGMSPLIGLFLLYALQSTAAPTQIPFSPLAGGIVNEIDPLKHLSAISPFYVPTSQPDPLPHGCDLTRVSLLIRHSAIQGNDDEFEQTMEPFIEKIKKFQKEDMDKLPEKGTYWGFLRDWECPINMDTVEVVSKRGKDDAKFLGKFIRSQYNVLFPKKKEGSVDIKKSQPYKVWTASSTRDIDTAKAYIKGGFPSHQSGPDGEGDGEVVQLIKVPNKDKNWDRSLTPHKACDTFEKESSLVPANTWLAHYTPGVRERLRPLMPNLADDLEDQDILAMQMLCGYETISQGHSHFCHLFTDDEWRNVEYYFDVKFHYMMGYGNNLSAYLGMPWVKTSKHLLDGKDSGGEDHPDTKPETVAYLKGGHKLPKPKLPPNATHSQLLHPSFTHRESPAFVAVFLDLYNSPEYQYPASKALPLDHRIDERAWRTSHLSSFLGHVAIERFSCPAKHHDKSEVDGWVKKGKKSKKQSFVRIVINGKQEKMGGCQDGIEGSCKWETYDKWIDERAEKWGDWESVCTKKDGKKLM